MQQANILSEPRALPEAVSELCARLEQHGIRTLSHGEGLLDDLANPPVDREVTSSTDPFESIRPTRSLLCVAEPGAVLRALPRSVVTGENRGRLTQATAHGLVDLICTGVSGLDRTLLDFGLGPYCFAFCPADGTWSDPAGQRQAFATSRLELSEIDPNPFVTAPRRYWIAARLIAECNLEASPELLAAAQEALPENAKRLPGGIPARRALARVLAARNPGPALAFLRESGVSDLLVPGTIEANEVLIGALPPLPSVRWAAFLRGSATTSALVRLRVPHALARRVERIQGSHPIERSLKPGREPGTRKLLQRHSQAEIEALFAWRRLELAAASNPSDSRREERPEDREEQEAELAALEARIDEARQAQEQTRHVRTLALDGRSVMAALGAGPGRHVGQALKHLTHFVDAHPDLNEPAALEAELFDWARQKTDLLD